MIRNEKGNRRSSCNSTLRVIRARRRRGLVYTFLEAVSIAEVEKNRPAIALRSFTAAERAELSGRRAQTMAGFLALKRALVRLASSVYGDASLCEKDFVLAHRANGAPHCLRVPPACAGVRVSVSHTRDWAYGLAAVQETR
jgi:phosphopantetheinyl transferase (holo-ACP synthase)